jgi:uncharacterized protein YjbJ (UPF0337 family)
MQLSLIRLRPSTAHTLKEQGTSPSYDKESRWTVSKKDKAKNRAQIAKGKVKEVAGHVTGDDQLEAEGQVDQSKGNLKQAVESVKDALQ